MLLEIHFRLPSYDNHLG